MKFHRISFGHVGYYFVLDNVQDISYYDPRKLFNTFLIFFFIPMET